MLFPSIYVTSLLNSVTFERYLQYFQVSKNTEYSSQNPPSGKLAWASPTTETADSIVIIRKEEETLGKWEKHTER